MPHLALRLLGPTLVTLDGRQVERFGYEKVLALATIAAMSQRRRHFLAVSPATVTPPRTLPGGVAQLQQVVELYRGDFFQQAAGCDSLPFEAWASIWRERLHQQVLAALSELTLYHEQHAAWAQLRAVAQRQLTLEPWRESAHRHIMLALALLGERGAALAQYEQCQRTLADELGGEFADGVFFVALAPLADPPLVAAAIAGTVGVRETTGQTLEAQLVGYLRDRSMLLVLDNWDCGSLLRSGPSGRCAATTARGAPG